MSGQDTITAPPSSPILIFFPFLLPFFFSCYFSAIYPIFKIVWPHPFLSTLLTFVFLISLMISFLYIFRIVMCLLPGEVSIHLTLNCFAMSRKTEREGSPSCFPPWPHLPAWPSSAWRGLPWCPPAGSAQQDDSHDPATSRPGSRRGGGGAWQTKIL